ncbi:MAG TPA: glycosyltransferase [Flavobacterium sp.]|nr:glycosyltransferase [Flavobacterium sp.]
MNTTLQPEELHYQPFNKVDKYFSFIIPVYNRPDEIDELLQSLAVQDFTGDYEVVLVEDGSSIDCKAVIENYPNLDISYYYKPNSGPGDSRNFGMRKAKGNYFLILDSDCVLPSDYLSQVSKALKADYVDCFGGIDTAEQSFSDIQKAINFAMTSVLSTGGVRGASEKLTKFQPRSFNMGISKEAFEVSGGFSKLHPGEDPDLAIRLWDFGFETRLFKEVSVFHKRRISWKKFYTQVHKFGKARAILNFWHPSHVKFTFFIPTAFLFSFLCSVLFLFFEISLFFNFFVIYFLACFFAATFANRNARIGLLSVLAVMIQLYGYGTGFLNGFYKIEIKKGQPKQVLPEMFF